ncbi:hepatocyte growth factor-regulated tyrosine kinase substrate isoform X2 [Cylas formicarius]|nr:hepatocyte growth factor-regulated tyrosine kinase substrate isoform X2 [Cylas formicarius]
MAVMKAEGYKFPVLRESDAMFAADTAPEWADGDVCHRCRVTFSMINRKHHCRACGQVFCGQCTTRTAALPKYGIEKEVRVCDSCYEQSNKPFQAPKSQKQEELPPEYLKSSLAQQKQEPPRKTDTELREEEELQLAIALSQSEADARENEKLKITNTLHNAYNKAPEAASRSPSPVEEAANPELAKYLNRSYWESIQSNDSSREHQASPSAPSPVPSLQSNESKPKHRENGVSDTNLEEFMKTLKSQVEIFINRMKSNSSRGRSIANDTSVQTLFMNITAMHSRLLKYIQEHDDTRLHYERLQDKLTQVKDARAALDALREEHREKLRREAEEAERQRQLQMAHKLEIMRKKKQEYLQYQRQLALQRIQEQEREMQMRQEQQKQQYMMAGAQFGGYVGSPVHTQQFPPNVGPPGVGYYGQFGQVLGQQPPVNAQMMHSLPRPSQGPLPAQQMPPQNQPPLGTSQQPPFNSQMPPTSAVPFHPQHPMMVQGGMPPGQNQGGQAPPQAVGAMPPHPQMQYQMGVPPQSPQQSQPQNKEDAHTAELISFD